MKRALALLCVLPLAASAQYLPYKMINTEAQPFGLYFDNRIAPPSGLSNSAVEAAVQRAVTTWNAPTCSFARLSMRGGSNGVVTDPQDTIDNFSVGPVWLQNGMDPDYREILGVYPVLAVTIPRSYAGVLQTCDVFVNGLVTWSTASPVATGVYDVESVMLHEYGHCLSLDHYGTSDDVMDQTTESGEERRTLSQLDTDNLCARYPVVGRAAGPCTSTGTCMSGLSCVAQPSTNGVTGTRCSAPCEPGTNAQCELPQVCVTSSAIPGSNGACLMPGDIVTRVGLPCVTDPECGSGLGFCRRPDLHPSGNSRWQDGYCTQTCGGSQPPCPAGSSCQETSDGMRCLASCRVGLADCRGGYTCLEVDALGTTGACYPSCYTNQDCNAAIAECRVCDGACIAKKSASAQIGDYCVDDSTCATGQSCRSTATTTTQKQCTVSCARGCGTCPAGTECTPGARGELFCLRSCTGPGTSAGGLRCADTPTGQGCQRWCQTNNDCPVGQFCHMGECYNEEFDAGCGTLCNRPDAGRPVVVVPTDGGTGGGTGGCGCASVDPLAVFAALALVGVRRRRRN
ncbi:MAG: matrixin family metalloprotease [Archangium sp.]